MNRLKHIYETVRKTAFVLAINRFLYSSAGVVCLGLMTFLAFVFSQELLFYSFVLCYASYVLIFCDDFAPLMPLFILCYITSSRDNNPGQSDTGLFYGDTGAFILVLAAVAVVIVLVRIILGAEIGGLAFVRKRRVLLAGLLSLSAAYMLSGVGSEHYIEYFQRNIIFALIQVAGVALLYVVFSGMVKWDKFNVEYFAYIGVMAGFVVFFELLWQYLTQDIVVDGVIIRENIYTGWGMHNNMGAIMTTAIPFAFYLASRKKHPCIYIFLSLVLTIGVVFSCSRSSMIFASLVFLLSYIYALIKGSNKKEFFITSVLLVSALGIVAFSLRDWIHEMFQKLPSIAEVIDGSWVIGDSGRLTAYRAGLEAFVDNPIFGQGFFSHNFDLYDFSVIEQFSEFFPPRWHSTIIQLLASCGGIGLLTYLYHRCQTIWLIIKRPSVINIFTGFYILALIGMSLLDCHFFNVGPVLFYSTALAVMEHGEEIIQS